MLDKLRLWPFQRTDSSTAEPKCEDVHLTAHDAPKQEDSI